MSRTGKDPRGVWMSYVTLFAYERLLNEHGGEPAGSGQDNGEIVTWHAGELFFSFVDAAINSVASRNLDKYIALALALKTRCRPMFMTDSRLMRHRSLRQFWSRILALKRW